ncbi:outer membrane beta-barrel protein [Vibrio variabilis]|uniref:outer membrane beta-barrel protein n=1 Tax=Vibrio variabilis TaxID=990271 RepID=UPI000DD79CEE|nr:outer membrane beta-barrel protein [Vibrio variabilis]
MSQSICSNISTLAATTMALPLLFMSLNSVAADKTGAFVGGSLGQLSNNANEHDLGFERFRMKSPAIGVYAGYHFTDWFGLEGQFSAADTSLEGSNSVIGVLSVSPKFSYYVNENIAVYTKVGVSGVGMTWDSEVAHQNVAQDDYLYGAGVHAGLGLNVAMESGINMRVDYTYLTPNIRQPDGYNLGDIDLSSLMLGVHYQF